MKALPKKGILIAVGELFLKSEGVKLIFKRKLGYNLSYSLKKAKIEHKLSVSHERLFVETPTAKKALKVVKNIFGIAWAAETFSFPHATLKEISEFVQEHYHEWIQPKETFALRLVGTKKSKEVIEELAKHITRKVDLSKPKREIFVEERAQGWFLYFKKQEGARGLPAGSGGKVLSLMSGGIDSPVASFLIAKRGAENVWLHFHSFPLVSAASIEKVRELARIFVKFQPRLKVIFIPFCKAQMEIKTTIPQKYRVLLYRRFMFRAGELIARREKCRALITGESLGQVSSQTLPNIALTQEQITLLILRPLIGADKEQIIELAKKIGTFEVSIRPHEDCCTLFVPKHATAQGDLETVKQLEKKLATSRIIQEMIEQAEIEEY